MMVIAIGLGIILVGALLREVSDALGIKRDRRGKGDGTCGSSCGSYCGGGSSCEGGGCGGCGGCGG